MFEQNPLMFAARNDRSCFFYGGLRTEDAIKADQPFWLIGIDRGP